MAVDWLAGARRRRATAANSISGRAHSQWRRDKRQAETAQAHTQSAAMYGDNPRPRLSDQTVHHCSDDASRELLYRGVGRIARAARHLKYVRANDFECPLII